jgi:hypothetical protein
MGTYKSTSTTKILLFATILIGTTQIAAAQKKYNLTGIVQDKETGADIVGATIKINQTSKLTTLTNTNGAYILKLPKGIYTISVSYIGYKSSVQTINFTKSQNIYTKLNIDNQLAVINITGNSDRVDHIRSTQMGMDHLAAQQMDNVPVLFGEKDIVKVVQLLPGVNSSSNGTNGFYVRGGNADENLILLDGATVYNPSHMLGFISTFNSDAVKDLDFYKGNIPAQYGGRLSSILDVRSNDGSDEAFGMSGGLGLISSHVELNAPIFNDGSFMVSARRTYADAILQASPDKSINSTIFHFYDLNTAFQYPINDNNSIHISGYNGSDNIGLQQNFETNWGNTTGTLKWDHAFSKAGSSTTALVYSNYQYQIENFNTNTAYNIQSEIKSTAVKQDFKFGFNENHVFRFGLSGTDYMLNPGTLIAPQTSQYNSFQIQKRNGFEVAAYLADEWQVNTKLRFDYGLRVNSFLLNGPYTLNQYTADGDLASSQNYASGKIAKAYLMLEPRFAVAYSLNNENSVKASYNRNTQNVHVLSNYSSSLPTDLYELSGPAIKPEIADQYSVGYYHSFSNKYDFSVESYYKNLMNQIDYKTGSNLFLSQDAESQIITGTGRAYGIEFLMKKNQGRLTGWLAYTLSRSERKFEQINNDQYFLSNFDRLHNVTVVAIYKVNHRLSVSGTFLYQTGTPITSPTGKYVVGGQTSFYYDTRNNTQLPVNSRADVGLILQNAPHKRFRSSWTLSVYDLYNRKNPYTEEFEQNAANDAKAEAVQVSLLGILPSLTWNFNF